MLGPNMESASASVRAFARDAARAIDRSCDAPCRGARSLQVEHGGFFPLGKGTKSQRVKRANTYAREQRDLRHKRKRGLGASFSACCARTE